MFSSSWNSGLCSCRVIIQGFAKTMSSADALWAALPANTLADVIALVFEDFEAAIVRKERTRCAFKTHAHAAKPVENATRCYVVAVELRKYLIRLTETDRIFV
jgi:hypothetical protein